MLLVLPEKHRLHYQLLITVTATRYQVLPGTRLLDMGHRSYSVPGRDLTDKKMKVTRYGTP